MKATWYQHPYSIANIAALLCKEIITKQPTWSSLKKIRVYSQCYTIKKENESDVLLLGAFLL
jgi:hypothetical protein